MVSLTRTCQYSEALGAFRPSKKYKMSSACAWVEGLQVAAANFSQQPEGWLSHTRQALETGLLVLPDDLAFSAPHHGHS